MSGTYPATPKFASTNFKSVFYNVSSTTITGRTQVRNIGGQRFEFSAAYPALTRAEFAPVHAFIMAQQGMAESFSIVLPQISEKSGDAAGTVVADGAGAIGDTSVDVDGATGTFKAGDVIKFAGHSKVYMIVSDVTAAAGAATINIIPALREAVADNEAVIFDDVPFLVRLNDDVQEYSLGLASIVEYEVDMIEAL
jgi:hypothetical protein